MERLPLIQMGDMSASALELHAEVTRYLGPRSGWPETNLPPSMNPAAYSASIGIHSVRLAMALNTETQLPPRVAQLVILTVVAYWESEYEWNSHRPSALRLGISEGVIAALAENGVPSFDLDDDRVAHEVAQSLLTTAKIPDDLYREAVTRFGFRGVVELVLLTGTYTLFAFQHNAFEAPLPVGVKPQWSQTGGVS